MNARLVLPADTQIRKPCRECAAVRCNPPHECSCFSCDGSGFVTVSWLVRPAEELQVPKSWPGGFRNGKIGDSGTADIWQRKPEKWRVSEHSGGVETAIEPLGVVCDVQVIDHHDAEVMSVQRIDPAMFRAIPNERLVVFCTNLREAEGT